MLKSNVSEYSSGAAVRLALEVPGFYQTKVFLQDDPYTWASNWSQLSFRELTPLMDFIGSYLSGHQPVANIDKPPVNHLYVPFKDFSDYSSPFAFGLTTLFGANLQFKEPTVMVDGNKAVTHSTVSGNVQLSDTSEDFTDATIAIGNFIIPLRYLDLYQGVDYVDGEYVLTDSIGDSIDSGSELLTVLASIMEQVEEHGVWQYAGPTWLKSNNCHLFQNEWFLSNFEFSYSGSRLTVEYDYTCIFHQTTLHIGCTPEWSQHVQGHKKYEYFLTVEANNFNSFDGLYPVRTPYRGNMFCKLTNTVNSHVGYSTEALEQAGTPDSNHGAYVNDAFDSTTGVYASAIFDIHGAAGKLNKLFEYNFPFHPKKYEPKHDLLSSFTRMCDQSLDDIRPSAFYTTVEALQDYLLVIKTNHLETLSELGEIGKILPNFSLAIQAFNDIRTGRFIRGGAKIIDFLTDANLLVKFGIAPNLDSAKEIVAESSSVIDTIQGINASFGVRHSKLITPLGSYFPGFPNATLITRSTVRAELGDTAIAALLFPGEAIGLLPRLGTLWDLVPFSFVVDWFFNIGTRLDNVDYSVLLSALTVSSCVHSFEIVGDIPTTVLNAYSFQQPEYGELATLRFYKREVSRFVPSLKESKIDFFPASGPSDFSVAGSLIWQVLS